MGVTNEQLAESIAVELRKAEPGSILISPNLVAFMKLKHKSAWTPMRRARLAVNSYKGYRYNPDEKSSIGLARLLRRDPWVVM